MSQLERQQAVLELLKNLRGLEPLKQLFWTELNYDRVNQPLSRRGWTDLATNALAEDPLLFAAPAENNFHIVYARLASDRLLRKLERPVVSRLLRDHPYALFVFSNEEQDRWHFLNVKYDEKVKNRRIYRRITVGPEERLRTASERLAMLDLESISPDLFGLSPLDVQTRHDEAFNVEAVTKQFYENYKRIFERLQDDLEGQTEDRVWAHDYALQFVNRIMFLYFVQRKRWLGDDTEFLRSFWESYKTAKQPEDTFFDQWLSVLFFEAFNNKFHGGHTQFPGEIKRALATAPYLNGGLFAQNELDQKHEFTMTDTLFEGIFDFLEHYNFTIAEDSPLDQEVAVDPEMIGKVYESLVNVSEQTDQRSEAGIFFTPRTEIDLMCRLALVDNLANHMKADGSLRALLYEAVFALEPEEKASADRKLAKADLWEKLDGRLREATVLDPACGSGSFLVGMLHVLDDLQARAAEHLGTSETSYERKKRIIGQSLYGVDVMDWACHVAELRLWLALIIDAEFSRAELKVRREPLLPHFTFKVRCGDSLVQEVGGMTIGHIRASRDIPSALKARITRLKTEKLKFYSNDPERKYRRPDQLEREELLLFRDILDTQVNSLDHRIKQERRALDAKQFDIEGKPVDELDEKTRREVQAAIQSLTLEHDRARQARAALKSTKDVPFVWEIAFVEVFEAEKSGFDIVIGNPPYVRHESIADPCIPREEVTTANKKDYKAKLARSVYQAFPEFFRYNPSEDAAARKIDAKSDLYIYFYLHGLSLLNPEGSFCFITSNSWLDVGYGKDLQEFLLRQCHVRMILDNKAKRSFAQADVNTVICLFSAPVDTQRARHAVPLRNVARFIMFTVPFEQILSAVIFQEVEEANERKTTPEYRVHPIAQEALLADGSEKADDDEGENKAHDTARRKGERSGPLIKVARYVGNKWGGKYLRAPDIYWTILEKGKGKLVRLGDIAEVRFGIKTGANEFFYLDEDRIREWGIEEEFLKPVIKSPRECKRILIDPNDLKYKIFMCHKDKKDLKSTAALDYIQWGESQAFHERPSCRGRRRWWDVGDRRVAPILSPSSLSELPRMFENDGVYADKRLYEVYPHSTEALDRVLVATNAITCSLFLELGSRTGLGEGLLDLTVYEVADLLVAIPAPERSVASALRDARQRPFLPLRAEISHADRRALDDIIFDVLGLTQGERDAVYEAVIDLVESRLNKARSV